MPTNPKHSHSLSPPASLSLSFPLSLSPPPPPSPIPPLPPLPQLTPLLINLNAQATVLPSSYSHTIHATILNPSGIFCAHHLTCFLAMHRSLSLSQGHTCLCPALLSQRPSNGDWVATSDSFSPSLRKPARAHILQPSGRRWGRECPTPTGMAG